MGLREHSFVLEDALMNGLRPHAQTKNNASYLVNMKNMKPTKQGAVVPNTVTYPLSDPALSMDWPFPHFVRDEFGLYLLGKTSIYKVDESDWTASQNTTYSALSPTSQLGITAGGIWHVAAFQHVRFLTNGQSLVFYAPSNYGYRVLIADALRVNTLCKHNNRLIFAGLHGDWLDSTPFQDLVSAWQETLPEHYFAAQGVKPYEHDPNEGAQTGWRWLMWSEPGGGASDIPFHLFLASLGIWGTAAYTKVEELAITAMEDGKLGFMPTATPGTIGYMKPLGDWVVLYGSYGISILIPEEDRYREQILSPVGIAGRGAVAGSDFEHVFLDSAGELWRFPLGGAPTSLGYREFFSPMTLSDVVITYDSVERDYWISDGSTAYTLTSKGLGGPMTIKPSSLLRSYDGSLYGTAIGIGTSRQAQIETGGFDIGERGTKHLVDLQVPYTGLTNLEAQTRYKYQTTEDWMGSPWKPISRRGVGYQGVSFVDGRVRIQGDVVDDTGQIQRIEVRYSPEDRSARRGTKGIPETA